VNTAKQPRTLESSGVSPFIQYCYLRYVTAMAVHNMLYH